MQGVINMPVNISAKDGNTLILSEEEYSEEYTKEKIVEGLNTSLDDCIPESEVEW